MKKIFRFFSHLWCMIFGFVRNCVRESTQEWNGNSNLESVLNTAKNYIHEIDLIKQEQKKLLEGVTTGIPVIANRYNRLSKELIRYDARLRQTFERARRYIQKGASTGCPRIDELILRDKGNTDFNELCSLISTPVSETQGSLAPAT